LSNPSSSLERDRPLEPSEPLALFEALADESAEVRIAAFEALTRLPLAPSDWLKVASFITSVLDAGDSEAERKAVSAAAPWVPVRSVRQRVALLADDPEARTDMGSTPTAMTRDRPPRTATWFGIDPPGFIDLSAEEWKEAAAALEVRDWRDLLELLELTDPHPDRDQLREQAIAVTLLFHEVLQKGREHFTNFLDGDIITKQVHPLQGSFCPDVTGLSSLYQLVAKELFREYRSDSDRSYFRDERYGRGPESLFRFAEREALGGPRAFCYQIGWTVSRGGVHGLVPRLATRLTSPDREDRMAAAYLIADTAGYFAYPDPPRFGGSDAPHRPEPAPQDQLIEDMLMAEPPPMAEAEPPPMEEAEPEAVEANGGGAPGSTRRRRRRPREVAEANGGAEAEAPSSGGPRWILVWVTDAAVPEELLRIAFRAGAVHEIAVAIGPNQEGAIAAVGGRPFDEELGPVADMEELTVTFLAPSISAPQSGSIFLPRTGTSRRVTFSVKLPSDLKVFDAEIHVHHRNRVVQMAKLHGPVVADPAQAPPGSRIELEVATIVPETVDLAGREGADAGIVSTEAGTTGIADKDLVGFDDDRLGRVVREGELLDILTGLATSDAARRRKLEDAVADLRALVFQGCGLYPVIGQPLVEMRQGRPLDRLQVLVDERSDFFPLELVYDLPAPAKDATLCLGWKTALRKGTCNRKHDAREGELHPRTFCPSGFWGLSKVIERKVVASGSWRRPDDPPGFDTAVLLEPTTDRHTLAPPREILFAASSRVDAEKKGGIASVQKALERIGEETTYAATWTEWVDGVTRRPTLLVLLPHQTKEQRKAALEIGEGETCLDVHLLKTFVRSSEDDAPIVLLLGCDTAVTDELQSFVSRFQDLGAALVVGTTASVLGQRAAPVARLIAADIAAAAKRRKPIAAGDLITSLRRKLLAKGELTALCLTAFGDAGWQLGGGNT
jgi:hypothetical protein